MQFVTTYLSSSLLPITRVTTVKGLWDTAPTVIASGFDQDAAVVALARWYLYKAVYEPKANLRQWLDKLLIRWVAYFATFEKGDTDSFVLPETMKYLPQYLYHFRRNAVVRRSGLSLDELTYHMHTLNR
jgi:protein transport protein SEC23